MVWSLQPRTAGLLQTIQAERTTDFTTVVIDPVFAVLLGPIAITTRGARLLVQFSCNMTSTAGAPHFATFRVLVDGSPVGAGSAATQTDSDPNHCGRVQIVSGVSAGAHTVTLECAKNATAPPGSLECLVATTPNAAHANLVVQEIR